MEPLVVGIGEVLWDVFPEGRRLGGAPANFAYHASRLGCHGVIASRVGDDALGREALASLEALGLDRSFVQVDPRLPTGTVSVEVDGSGKPAYVIHAGVAWDALELTAPLRDLARRADAICFGTLASRGPLTRAAVRGFLEAARPGCLRIFDVNLRQDHHTPEEVLDFLRRCEVLKLNEGELPAVAAMAGAPGASAGELRARFAFKVVALTLGEKGSLLCTGNGILEEPGLPIPVVDTVGAGDAFTAALAAGMLRGEDLARVHGRASRLAAFLCGCPGAMPDMAGFAG